MNMTNSQTSRRQPMRSAPSKYLTSRLRWHVERSEGIHISEAFYPSKFLPVLWQDDETGEGCVITKGTIVSCITDMIGASGMASPSKNEVIPVFQDKTNSNAVVTASIDNSFWGYPQGVVGLLVPCNGGVDSEIPYTTLDVTLGTFAEGDQHNIGGQLVTPALVQANAAYTVKANMPIGIVYQDVYQDIRGGSLNYQTFDIVGVCCDYYIEIPYVDFTVVSAFVSGYVDHEEDQLANITTGCGGYLNTWKKYPFLYFKGSDNSGHPGQLLCSDLYGKFIPQGTGVTTAATAQTVGKLIVTDCRYPKGAMDMVDTFPDSRMPGTETGGLPGMLFEFVRDSYFGINGSYPTIAQVVAEVQDGKYGMCRIQLNI